MSSEAPLLVTTDSASPPRVTLGERDRPYWRQRAVAVEALCFLALAGLGLRLFPMQRLMRWLDGGSLSPTPEPTATPEAVRDAVRRAAAVTPWRTPCLAQAVAGKAMLRRRKVRSTLYLGVAREGGTTLSAHAWLCCDKVYVTGGPGHEAYSVIARFPSAASEESECRG